MPFPWRRNNQDEDGEDAGDGIRFEWETCEIQHEAGQGRWTGSPRVKFFASAVGPRGRFGAAESEEVRVSDYSLLDNPATPRGEKEMQRALDDLVRLLVKQGWEPVETRGQFWFSLRFRRRV